MVIGINRLFYSFIRQFLDMNVSNDTSLEFKNDIFFTKFKAGSDLHDNDTTRTVKRRCRFE